MDVEVNEINNLREKVKLLEKKLIIAEKALQEIKQSNQIENGCSGCRFYNSCGIRLDYGNGGCHEKQL